MVVDKGRGEGEGEEEEGTASLRLWKGAGSLVDAGASKTTVSAREAEFEYVDVTKGPVWLQHEWIWGQNDAVRSGSLKRGEN